MKKITPLVFALFLFVQVAAAQQLTHSASQNIEDGNSLACNFRDIDGNVIYVEQNTFYRHFDLDDFSISSSYDITSIDYGIEQLENAPAGGFPVTVGIYRVNGIFPNGSLTLITEVTENLQDQALTIRNVPIATTIAANDEFVVAISIPSDDPSEGGLGQVKFQIGSNDAGETDHSYLSAPDCSLNNPIPFMDQGRPDLNLVINVNGNGAVAGTGDLDLVGFSYFPNPVKRELRMRADQTITNVAVYNILGQKIRSFAPSDANTSLDLTSLTSGTYMVKAQVNDRVGTFKVVKE
ncbi:MAG: T9SS type A sorting domain-containing protein [Flavobacteriaceae bacterium]|nr:T9SS type A sorting domain-containing protein [Flavobacteriaceae bacterium]